MGPTGLGMHGGGGPRIMGREDVCLPVVVSGGGGGGCSLPVRVVKTKGPVLLSFSCYRGKDAGLYHDAQPEGL